MGRGSAVLTKLGPFLGWIISGSIGREKDGIEGCEGGCGVIIAPAG